MWRCNLFRSGFLANSNFPRVARQSANEKGDNEMIHGLCTDLLAFTLRLRKTPENSNRRPSDESRVASDHLKWSPLFPNKVIGRITEHIRKGERRKGWGEIHKKKLNHRFLFCTNFVCKNFYSTMTTKLSNSVTFPRILCRFCV